MSVDAVQLRLICVPPDAAADKLVGAVGGVASVVVAVTVLEYAPRFPAASVARTRYEYVVPPGTPVSV